MADNNSSRDEGRWTARAMEWLPLMWILPATTFIGWGLGRLLDHLIGTNFLYMVFLLAGIGVGLWMLLRQINKLNREG